MTKEDSERKKNYANEYNKRASDIATGKSVPLPGGPVPFYYTIKTLDKISKCITNLFSDDVKKPKLKKPKLDKPKIKAPKLKD
jgi:hypothetical protein